MSTSIDCYVDTEPMAREKRALEIFHRDRVRLVGVHLDLLENHLALASEIIVGDLRVEIHVGDDVDRLVKILERHMGEIRRRLFARPGVEIAAPPFDGAGDLHRGTFFRPLEKHMLDEVGYPRDLVRLVARAGGDEKPERHRLRLARNKHDSKTVI